MNADVHKFIETHSDGPACHSHTAPDLSSLTFRNGELILHNRSTASCVCWWIFWMYGIGMRVLLWCKVLVANMLSPLRLHRASRSYHVPVDQTESLTIGQLRPD
ncbi:unnamed protein product [Protopolystoma xenopodis]|uniref:Uncharacterized protein n=1 Tax=Protopolystoma xenopodis TaxID=117903 RepID=A0A448XJ53_9PLAT|nr:unnamed protein product [Protopolystoma xenopodis]